ncbi:hypothetical protein EYF80_018297 [Liparis tanakae]|uniref:Uncharacterized protein n=1 Tax=Liparis tanakae TaxID=230148 RepID=A0A4Z2I2J5_9TELE|nr:hypothetical protein EYF80_018297 [Liparis tanakae]
MTRLAQQQNKERTKKNSTKGENFKLNFCSPSETAPDGRIDKGTAIAKKLNSSPTLINSSGAVCDIDEEQ